MTDEELGDSVYSWCLSESADATAEYARSGRKHRCLSDEDLEKKWIDAFRAVANDFTNGALWQAQSDLVAEFALRDKTPPYGLIAVEQKQLLARMMLAAEEIGFEPSQNLLDNFLLFLSETDAPKN